MKVGLNKPKLQIRRNYIMVMTDPIADFLTRIRNGNMRRFEVVEAPASKIKREIAEILKLRVM